MARPTLKKQVELPGGAGVIVTGSLRLVASASEPGRWAYADVAGVDVGGVRTVRSTSAGLLTWSNVRPNSGASDDAITTPEGTVYEVTVRFPDGTVLRDFVDVPDQTGDVWVQDILAVGPEILDPITERVQDIVGAMVVAGTGIEATYTDASGTLTLAATGGGEGSGTSYRHVQSTPSTTWTVAHGLGYRPAITVTDTAGTEMEAGIDHVDTSTATVTLLTALAGYAECS